MDYKTTLSDSEIALRKKWHEAIYIKMEDRKKVRMQYLGRKLVVPREVTAPAWMSKLLGKTILQETEESDRVLDMGTGSGINAILAASKSTNVLGVDLNPFTVEAAKNNARINGVQSRTEFRKSDLFENVEGKFNLIIFDPPFRWFKPRDIREAAVADERFRSMTAFFGQVKNYIAPGGRVLIIYGDSGDLAYLLSLIERNGFNKVLMRSRFIDREGRKWGYYVWKLTI